MYIDVDTHFTPLEFYQNIPQDLGDVPRLVGAPHEERIYFPSMNVYHRWHESSYDIKLRKDAMKEAGFDKSCLLNSNSTIPDFLVPLREESIVYMCRKWNDLVARLVEDDDSFIGIAQVPHFDPNKAIEETERAVGELGFRSVQLQGNWGTRNMEDRDWWPFFESVQRLGIPLWCHGEGGTGLGKANPLMPGSLQVSKVSTVSPAFPMFLWQGQLIILGMIFSGIFDKFPALKIAILEVDIGWIPHFMSFVDFLQEHAAIVRNSPHHPYYFDTHSEGLKLRKKASQYLKENFVFSINNASESELNFLLPILVNKFDMEHNILAQTDFPHIEGDLEIVRKIRNSTGINEAQKDLILGKNAQRILRVQ